jgi:hypothetical protein
MALNVTLRFLQIPFNEVVKFNLTRFPIRRGFFAAFKNSAHSVPFCLQLAELIFHLPFFLKWGVIELIFKFFNFLLKPIEIPSYQSNRHG